MTPKKGKKPASRVKNLPARSVNRKQAKQVKGGALTVKQKVSE
jgi:hypothetical protein